MKHMDYLENLFLLEKDKRFKASETFFKLIGKKKSNTLKAQQQPSNIVLLFFSMLELSNCYHSNTVNLHVNASFT